LVIGDDPVLGVVAAPALGTTWWASTGAGAWSATFGGPPCRLSVSGVTELADASVSYTELTGWGRREKGFTDLLGMAWRTRAYGDFWSHMLVAEGAVDVAAEPTLALWDLAALVPIVSEAGGSLTSVEGTNATLEGSAVSTNGLLHAPVLRLLNPD
jgi:histidinol-phosphatase